jgi:periplasmic nitrate reductase NapE
VTADNASTAAGKAPRNDARRAEIFAFVVLAILIWPVVAIGVVGGYGFLVWMSQIVFGPPGPPH